MGSELLAFNDVGSEKPISTHSAAGPMRTNNVFTIEAAQRPELGEFQRSLHGGSSVEDSRALVVELAAPLSVDD